MNYSMAFYILFWRFNPKFESPYDPLGRYFAFLKFLGPIGHSTMLFAFNIAVLFYNLSFAFCPKPQQFILKYQRKEKKVQVSKLKNLHVTSFRLLFSVAIIWPSFSFFLNRFIEKGSNLKVKEQIHCKFHRSWLFLVCARFSPRLFRLAKGGSHLKVKVLLHCKFHRYDYCFARVFPFFRLAKGESHLKVKATSRQISSL